MQAERPHSIRDVANVRSKRLLLRPARFFNANSLYVSRLGMACARGALNVALRTVDSKKTWPWGFSAFSQTGRTA
jgi:hypothetical protein